MKKKMITLHTVLEVCSYDGCMIGVRTNENIRTICCSICDDETGEYKLCKKHSNLRFGFICSDRCKQIYEIIPNIIVDMDEILFKNKHWYVSNL